MRLFRKASIQRKQTLIILLTSGAALLLACLAFVAYEIATFRTTMVRNLSTLAEIIGNNTTAALDFNDTKNAEETLSALKAERDIIGAGVYTKDGQIFAVYDRQNDQIHFVPPPVQAAGHAFNGHALVMSRTIVSKGDKIGTVYVESDLRDLYSRLQQYVLIVLGVFSAATFVAFILSARLQRVISEPILQLVRVTRQVAEERNYSTRASKQTDDELGTLVDGFNAMLEQIQLRDAELSKANVTLEQRVQERTGELANSVSLLNATLESTNDGIFVLNSKGEVTDFNAQFTKMWAIPKEIAATGDKERMIEFVLPSLQKPDAFLATIMEMRGKPEAESFDLLDFKDGRVFERYSKPQRIGDKSVGRVWSFRDITERRKAEEELEDAHKQLLDTSRRAGMAEVASNVLHNVGNVLNSVNVSAALLADRIRGSKVSSLVKAMALMRQHHDHLAAFLSEDPKGRQLPAFLFGVVEYLTEEQKGLLKELESLGKNIEHIKDIVAMQQSYAKVSGVSETIPPVELIEDALRMNEAAFVRHQVQIIREYEEVPPITVEKHKVLQILVNLMRNAKYAMDEAGNKEKPIRLRLERKDDESIRISVTDCGVGIPAENLTRIFNHGFTTRKNGHGFGLHSGALAAKELGGSLTVHSDGLGKGASFTLELPLQQITKPNA